MKNITCRQATAADLGEVYGLVRELAIYEHALESLTFDLEGYYRCFDEGVFEAIVATTEGKIVGACVYYLTFSTWKGKMLYLEDFVVTQSYRKEGIGQKLWDAYIAKARELDCALVKWQVLDWNQPAIQFYLKNGATIEKEWWNGKIVL